ncbi:ATP-binding protein [Mesorhizobium sp. M0053]|uniref:ATP-binding protein n=1 Tax=Mesorhizobium sp. M0053 TaxID=2956864 RepID=UPI003337E3AE
MESLEHYLGSDYLAEKQEIKIIDQTLGQVERTFSHLYNPEIKSWPYEFRASAPSLPTITKSQGTLAMALLASGRILGCCQLPAGNFREKTKSSEPLVEHWRAALGGLLTLLQDGVRSSTFGANNPITISHIAELAKLIDPIFFEAEVLAINTVLDELRVNVKNIIGKLLGSNDKLIVAQQEGWKYYRSSFVPLRALRAAEDLGVLDVVSPQNRVYFESTLHDHLSFSAIPDSRFDPAELMFCLEGLMICAKEAVDRPLLDRILSVLSEKQNSSAHWRPNKPFLSSATGQIMLPLSVEGANSLMRSVGKMDGNGIYDTCTAKCLPLIDRFWHWLRARSVRFEKVGTKCVGWHSEHVNEPDLVHIWDTSQVAEFMFCYREMINRHIAAKSLRLSLLDIKRPRPKKDAPENKLERWKKKVEDFEPNLGHSDETQQVYSGIGSDFVRGWATGKPVNFSMLLYGPPGTGKSTAAENLAEVLEVPLITVTVSDFLGSGGANVESRAKAIFQTLEAQQQCVILFDEIDSFLLDRDSRRYREQDSLFQFLTPGMLTKINDLRRRKRSIFIIATNYESRIDPAIKRAGRIDKLYLLPLPNRARRKKILETEGLGTDVDEAKDNELARASAFFGFPDLKGAVVGAPGGAPTADSVIKSLKLRPPATSIESYLLRLEDPKDKETFPYDELVGLVALAKEVGLPLPTPTQNQKERLTNEGPAGLF